MSYCCVVERGPGRLQACGRIWAIEQTEHAFWVRVEWTEGSGVRWSLFFDVTAEAMSPRRARLAIETIDDPAEIEWRVSLTGREEGA